MRSTLLLLPRSPLRRTGNRLVQQGEAADHVLVQHAHLGGETGALLGHLGADGRKFTAHFRPQLRNLRREVVDPGGKFFESGHARLEAFDSGDRKSTRLNSSHSQISYAVFCLKKKKKK